MNDFVVRYEWRGIASVRQIRDFHHYLPEKIDSHDKISRLEWSVANLLIENNIGDENRESSAIFELKHSSNVTQFARLLSPFYGIDRETAAAGALLHDIYVIVEGKYKDHAKLGVPIADSMLVDHGIISSDKRNAIKKIVGNHSDKNLYSNDLIKEFGKDIDVLDCFLYPNAIEFYLLNKEISNTYHYLARAKSIWRKLNIPIPKSFQILDGLEKQWIKFSTINRTFNHISDSERSKLQVIINSCKIFSIFKNGNEFLLGTNTNEATKPLYRLGLEGLLSLVFDDSSVSKIKEKLEEDFKLIVWPALGVYEILGSSQKESIRFSSIIQQENVS